MKLNQKTNMPSRFTQTDKWTKDTWFIELPFIEKGIFQYLCENCDIAGFYELSMKRLRNDLAPLTDDEIKNGLKKIERSYVLSRDKKVLFLKNFCKHQNNAELNPKNNAHRGIIKLLVSYQPIFAFDLLKIVKRTSTRKSSPKNEGLQRGLGIGNINFIEFYNLYAYKVGNKANCEKKWNELSFKDQEIIMAVLPKWKAYFGSEGHILPYPETFINQKRWLDEIPDQPTMKVIKSDYPDYWDPKFEDKIPKAELSKYWNHLRELGLEPKRDREGRVVDWVKKQAI